MRTTKLFLRVLAKLPATRLANHDAHDAAMEDFRPTCVCGEPMEDDVDKTDVDKTVKIFETTSLNLNLTRMQTHPAKGVRFH